MTPDLYNELSYYSLAHQGSDFIHQNVVDAFTAQTANSDTKKIALFFALAGLYLTLEKGYTGRQVQLAHLKMANCKDLIPKLLVPDDKGSITIEHVLMATEGNQRDRAIKAWCASVWGAYSNQRDIVINSTDILLITTKSKS
jgi:hypothetical protein